MHTNLTPIPQTSHLSLEISVTKSHPEAPDVSMTDIIGALAGNILESPNLEPITLIYGRTTDGWGDDEDQQPYRWFTQSTFNEAAKEYHEVTGGNWVLSSAVTVSVKFNQEL